jgi:hypothetical protein
MRIMTPRSFGRRRASSGGRRYSGERGHAAVSAFAGAAALMSSVLDPPALRDRPNPPLSGRPRPRPPAARSRPNSSRPPVQTPRPLKQEIEHCDTPAAARRLITAAPRLELDDLGRRQLSAICAYETPHVRPESTSSGRCGRAVYVAIGRDVDDHFVAKGGPHSGFVRATFTTDGPLKIQPPLRSYATSSNKPASMPSCSLRPLRPFGVTFTVREDSERRSQSFAHSTLMRCAPNGPARWCSRSVQSRHCRARPRRFGLSFVTSRPMRLNHSMPCGVTS